MTLTIWRLCLMSTAAALALLGGCAGTPNSADAMARQADAQIQLAKLQDKEARAEYDDQNVYLGLIGRMQQEGMYYASLAHIDAFQKRFGTSTALQVLRADALRETGQDDAALQAYRELLTTDRAGRAHHGIGLVLGVFMLILDFDYVEQGVAAGLEERESWRAAFALTVSLIWIYTNLLRILAIINQD